MFVKNAKVSRSSRYTDDSLMSVAVCDALLKVKGKNMSDEDIKKTIKNLNVADVVECLKSISKDSRTIALGKLGTIAEAANKAKQAKTNANQVKKNEGLKK